MTKREQKLNRLWNYLIKGANKDTLHLLSIRGFLYSTGRISYEEALLELSATFLGIDIIENENFKTLIDILECQKGDGTDAK